jgi:choloylglycine hydrolase
MKSKHVILSLLFILIIGYASPVYPCSTFALKTDKGLFFAHNLDQPGADVPGLIFLNQRDVWKRGYSWARLLDSSMEVSPTMIWKSRFGSVTFSAAGKDFPDGGLNEKGLFIWEMTLKETQFISDTNMPKLFMMTWIQYVLDNYSSVNEVIKSCDQIALDGWNWHFFSADQTGNAACIEFIDGKAVIHEGLRMPIPVLCNSIYSDELKWLSAFQGFGGAYSVNMDDHRISRFIHAATMISEYNSQDPIDYSFNILGQLGGINTRWSVVFDVNKMQVWFKTSINTQLRYFKFDLKDFEQNMPLLMLDIDCTGSGNVKNKFTVSTFEKNLTILKGLLDLYFTNENERHMIDSMGVTTLKLAEIILQKMKLSEYENNFNIAGTWVGKVLFPNKGSLLEMQWSMDLKWDNEILTGKVKDSVGIINDLAMANISYNGGLLKFTLKDESSKFILYVNLAVGSKEMKGPFYAYLNGEGSVHLKR